MCERERETWKWDFSRWTSRVRGLIGSAVDDDFVFV